MRSLLAVLLISLPAAGLLAQNRAGGFGNVVFPGGTSATMPGTQRFFGNAAFPGTGGPQARIPFSITDPTFGARLGATVGARSGYPANSNGRRTGLQRNATVLPFAYPVYVGNGYDAPAPQAQPSVNVVYPPQPAPVIINNYYGTAAPPAPDTVRTYQAPITGGDNPEGRSITGTPTGYLIAFKDHTIYSAVAYWVEGDTLHYFTNGNNHNQASVSLVDRDLTDRLNREQGTEVRLPR